VQEKCPKR